MIPQKNLDGGQNKTNEKNYIFFFIFCNVEAATITDYELENLLKNYIKIIQEKNNAQQKIKFIILFDESPNAFINEKEFLFVTTGLIKYTPSYEALIGVLAHEIGHVENYHIKKRIKSIKNLRSINKLGTLSMIATSILSNNSEYLMQSILTNQFGIKNYYSSFSREQEREADIYAIKTLNNLNLSSLPLRNFLKLLEKESNQKGINQENYKFSSHPIYKERFDIIDNISIKNSSYLKLNTENYFFAKAKLFGFTEMNKDKLHKYLTGDYLDYAESIILSRNGKLKESLIKLNILIDKYPDNFYLLETKADLLLAHGYSKEANEFYKIVLNKDNNNQYAKKRIFDIKYDEINKKQYLELENFFDDFSELMIIFPNDKILLKKFKQVSSLLDKKDWSEFIDANMLIIETKKNLALNKFNNILLNTKDKKLIKFINKRIKMLRYD